jgi:hypothetical protein
MRLKFFPYPGAPPSNATFVGDAQGSLFYSYVPRKANFSEAVRGCTARNGSLVTWKAGASQYSVERYFYQNKVLGKYYWQGISRPRQTGAFTYIDGSQVSPLVSNTRPYAHWWVVHMPHHCSIGDGMFVGTLLMCGQYARANTPLLVAVRPSAAVWTLYVSVIETRCSDSIIITSCTANNASDPSITTIAAACSRVHR